MATSSARRISLILLTLSILAATTVSAAMPAPDGQTPLRNPGQYESWGSPVPQREPGAVDSPRSGTDPVDMLAAMADGPPTSKLAPGLLAAADHRRGGEALLVVVLSAKAVDLSAYSHSVHSFTWPAGEHVSILRARWSDLPLIAATDGVARVASGEIDLFSNPFGAASIPPGYLNPDSGLIAPQSLSREGSGAPRLQLMPAVDGGYGDYAGDSLQSQGDEGSGALQGWHDVRDGHSAAEAWAMGYSGKGVLVGVLDTGVDYAHHDLQGTWPVLPDFHAYAGWPQVYDPTSTYMYAMSRTVDPGSGLLRTAMSGFIELYQESEVTEEERDGEAVRTACFQPLQGAIYGTSRSLGPEECDFVVPESKGGHVRFGHHPDRNLARIRSAGGPPGSAVGEFVGVLLVDADEAGLYHTVYVDLDSDHDFTDERPLTKESPLSWRDISRQPDGIADLSGGLLYYLADGVNPVPGAYLWGLEEDVPDAGTLVGLFFDQDAHGTLCASNVVSQGRLGSTRGRLSFRDLPGGAPEHLNPGMAPEARVVGIGNVYSADVVFETAWRYVLFGHDPDSAVDDIQIASNSYGWSDVDNDGWDADSRFIDYYVRHFGPHTSFLVSTGNGAPGYGTLAPPSPTTGMGIGSSTQFGSAVGLSITDTMQITFGDIAEMSNRGPTADGRSGPDVTANGANGWGAVPLNLLSANAGLIDAGMGLGARANVPWGGTSRSSPIAAGGLALTYEAFADYTGRWPSWPEARGIYKSGARFAAYDTFTMGAGVVDIADSVRIAVGEHGIFAEPSEWTPGGYRGDRFPGFAKLITAGASDSVTLALNNPGTSAVEATLSSGTLRRLGGYEQAFDTALDTESEYNSAIPNYLVPLDKYAIPSGTELVIVQAVLPLDQADVDGDGEPVLENSFTFRLIQHTDINGDGLLWTDHDQNGSVGFVTVEGAIDWASAEVDRYEFEALNEHSAETNNWTITAHHPLERWKDGLYIGVWHAEMVCEDESDPTTCAGRTPLMPDTTMQLKIEFYAYEEWGWLALDSEKVSVPPGGSAGFTAALGVPVEAAPGSYGGAIFADYDRAEDDPPIEPGGGYELPVQRVVIPVNVNVAADYDWLGTVKLGGGAADDERTRLNNGVLRGGLDRSWRPETGDWRFFFLDADMPAPGTHWLVRTSWDDGAEHSSDIDTSIWSRSADRFSDPSHPDNSDEDWSDPAWFGPYTLDRVGSSADAHVDGGTWRFDTTSGGNEDWITGPASEGLTELMLHNVLFSGSQFQVPFEAEVGSINILPYPIKLYADECTPLMITSQIALDGFELRAVGLSEPEELTGMTVSPEAPYTHTVTVDDVAARFIVDLRGEPGTDIDLAILFDAEGDGVPDLELARSGSPTWNERIELRPLQPAGDYLVVVESLGLPEAESSFDLTVDVVVGDDLQAGPVPPSVEAGNEYVLDVCAVNMPDSPGPMQGVVVFGDEGGPAVMSVPVTWWSERPEVKVYIPMAHRF